ncbi:MAG: DUF547 domain-containing protein [Planctomycetota bacterium]|nr:DUF547 domain-containing protein [Planctomycetota bacterium]
MMSRFSALAAISLPLLACAASGASPAPDRAAGSPLPTSVVAQAPVPAPEAKPSAFDAIHGPWSAILAKHVRGGDFDYATLAKERAGLDAYVAALEAVNPDAFAALTPKERFAFWINAYNAYTVKRVVDGYPVKSIRDLGDEKTSVWDRDFVPLGRLFPKLAKDKLTLNDIENKILRPTFQDARLHAAVNCASKGCPALRAEAFTSAKLDAQLDEQVKRWLADTTRNRLDRAKSSIEVSKVFEWFAEDFQREAGSARAWIARFRPEDKDWLDAQKKVEVKFVEYDWALNGVQP